MSQINATRPDPAPSRVAYKLQRLLLTPMFRAFLRIGVPMGTAAAVGMFVLGDQDVRDSIHMQYVELKRSVQERPEFMLHMIAIDGASTDVATDIREIVPVDFPMTSFDLNLSDTRDVIASLDAVADVDVRIRAGGVLQIDVVERDPVVVWRGPQGVETLDAEGHRVGGLIARAERTDLPLITGTGAEMVVDEALALFEASGPLQDRMLGMIRVGERRWNVALADGQTLMLPEENPVAALEQIIALDQAQDLLARDVVAIDMRNQSRPTIRLSSSAVDELRRIRGDFGVSSQ
ncbi:cell division protein FtsQ/DivIB [Cochlodiniinecator piscidefendens]|uniref:cell division protein FtsQ/DivIB n=1 Tax=Cochlodiniinecator piscidefendens TaxID=2715756 RepID=UPI00140895D3|nr:cell division protein FtsQ/DivIB [Cochlodiniinecator piscidefendens]